MNRPIAALATTLLTAALAVVVASPAQAYVPRYSTVTVTNTGVAQPHANASLVATCPAGTTPTTGGIEPGYGPERYQDYVDYGDGASVTESVNNSADWPQNLTVTATCAPISDFTSAGRVVGKLYENNSTHYAGGYTSCPAGTYALSARVDWNEHSWNNRIDYSGPTWDLTGWVVHGIDQGFSNYMIVDLQCVTADYLAGRHLVTASWANPDSASVTHRLTVACPSGTTMFNGGSFTQRDGDYSDYSYFIGLHYASDASGNGWTAAAEVPGAQSGHSFAMWITAWCVPSSNPVITFTAGPTYETHMSAVSIQWISSDPAAGGGYTEHSYCTLDGGAVFRCDSGSFSTGALAEGAHSFEVQAVTSDGREALPALWQWIYDVTAPTASTTRPTAAFTAAITAKVAWTGADGGSGIGSFDVRYRQAPYDGSFGAEILPSGWQAVAATSTTAQLAEGTTYCFSARSRDQADNTSPWSTERCTARPIDDTHVTYSGTWTNAASPAYYGGSSHLSSTPGAKLSKTGVHLDRVGIIASTCSTCGTVDIFVGATRIGSVDLHSAIAADRVLFTLPRFSARTGTVSVRVTSTSGLEVRIDGLSVSQA